MLCEDGAVCFTPTQFGYFCTGIVQLYILFEERKERREIGDDGVSMQFTHGYTQQSCTYTSLLRVYSIHSKLTCTQFQNSLTRKMFFWESILKVFQ